MLEVDMEKEFKCEYVLKASSGTWASCFVAFAVDCHAPWMTGWVTCVCVCECARAIVAIQPTICENRFDSRNTIDNMQLFHAFIRRQVNAWAKRIGTKRRMKDEKEIPFEANGATVIDFLFAQRLLFRFFFSLLSFWIPATSALAMCAPHVNVILQSAVDDTCTHSLSHHCLRQRNCLCLSFQRFLFRCDDNCAAEILLFFVSDQSVRHAGNEAAVAVNGCHSFNQKLCRSFFNSQANA